MTVGDYPEYLAVGYLVNQNIIKDHTKIEKVEVVDDINTVVVRSSEETLIDISNERKIKTSGCANGTIFDNIIDQISEVKLDFKQKIKVDANLCIIQINKFNAFIIFKIRSNTWVRFMFKRKTIIFF